MSDSNSPSSDQGESRSSRNTRPIARLVWPLLILLLAAAIFALMTAFKPELTPQASERILSAVRVLTVEPQAVQLTVRSQGTVKPLVESNLTPEVSGSVVWVSPALVSGGNFEKDEPLLRIDDKDYRNAVERIKSRVKRAEVEYELAQSEYSRQSRLLKQKLTSQSQLDQADRAYRVAEANRTEMRIELKQARLDLERTRIATAFSGRVQSETVDIGQFVSRGETVASLYATDVVEVRLPIANRQFAFLDLAATTQGLLPPELAPRVVIVGQYAGREYEWQSTLVRIEAAIDASTRMFHGVASVVNPPQASVGHQPDHLAG